jgi:hypothetical protein
MHYGPRSNGLPVLFVFRARNTIFASPDRTLACVGNLSQKGNTSMGKKQHKDDARPNATSSLKNADGDEHWDHEWCHVCFDDCGGDCDCEKAIQSLATVLRKWAELQPGVVSVASDLTRGGTQVHCNNALGKDDPGMVGYLELPVVCNDRDEMWEFIWQQVHGHTGPVKVGITKRLATVVERTKLKVERVAEPA